MAEKNQHFLKHILLILINVKQRLFHHVTDEEIELIKNSHLFDSLDTKSFEDLSKSEQIISYVADDLIFKEGDIANELYIVADGAVRVFTITGDNKKIALARLNKGDYFGEQALLGELNKTRNASIEAITDTTLIRISQEFIIKVLGIDLELRERLKIRGHQQIIDNLGKTLEFYQSLKGLINSKDYDFIEMKKDQVLFKAGDNSDYVYIIVNGSASIVLPQDSKSEIKLKKGHIFGELGVLNNTKRAASAIIREHSRLMRISGEQFKELHASSSQLQQMLTTLKATYLLPNKDVVEQSFGKVMDMDCLTTIYKLNDGRTVIALHTLNGPFFVMKEENIQNTELYTYIKDADTKIELKVKDNHIVSIQRDGIDADVSKICSALLSHKEVVKPVLEAFQRNGLFNIDVLQPDLNLPDIVCDCMSVKRDTVEELMNKGVNSFAMISNQTGACTVCGSCRVRILGMLGQNIWVYATLKKIKDHKDNVASYFLQSVTEPLNAFTPGEHVVIQVRIDENWVERAYTISDISDDGKFRITIKKEDNGFFTKWLFNNSLEQLSVYCSQPQGNFTLRSDVTTPILCIAGGIGITPFFTFARMLQKENKQRRMHLIYIARTKDDHLFTEEFNEITINTPSITIEFWEKKISGIYPDENLAANINNLEGGDIYICGPEGFEVSLVNSLNNLNFPADKIHIEKFTYANPIQTKEEE